jgi:hypothetical protein
MIRKEMIKEPRIAADILTMPHGVKLLSDRFKGGDEVVSQPHLVQKGGGSETLCQSLSVHVSRMMLCALLVKCQDAASCRAK